MKRLSLLQTILLLATSIFCSLTIACGAGAGVYGPGEVSGLGTASIAKTQNPLVAQYTVTTALTCAGQIMVEFGLDTSYGRNTAWYPVAAGSVQNTILVAGMRASTTYHMRSQAQCADGSSPNTSGDLTFTTGTLPSVIFPPSLTVTRPNPSLSATENPGIEMLTVTAGSSPAFFTDRDGNPIWYYDVGHTNFPYTFKLLPNGHIIVSIAEPNSGGNLVEVDLAGNTIRAMDAAALGAKVQAAGFDFVPATYHHDLLPLDNGHLLVLTNFTKSFTNLPGYPGTTDVLGDGIVDLDPNWNPVWAWNSFDYLDVNRHLNGLPDWTHSNALLYSASDGNLLLSMRHQSWVLKIDYNNGAGAGDVVWKLGYQGDFSLSQGDDPSLWFSFQHFPSIIAQSGTQTTLAIWDNGDNRVLDTSGTICGSVPPATPCYSRATKFQIDESAMVASLLWADLPGLYGVWGGSINELGNGNVEFDANAITAPGVPAASEVMEVTQTSAPQVVWQMTLPFGSNAYRGYRVPSLYPGVTWQY